MILFWIKSGIQTALLNFWLYGDVPFVPFAEAVSCRRGIPEHVCGIPGIPQVPWPFWALGIYT